MIYSSLARGIPLKFPAQLAVGSLRDQPLYKDTPFRKTGYRIWNNKVKRIVGPLSAVPVQEKRSAGFKGDGRFT